MIVAHRGPGPAWPPPLDQPYPGAPIGEVWRRFWKKGLTFSGRASRSEFWKLAVLQFLVAMGLYVLVVASLFAGSAELSLLISGGLLIWAVAIMIPSLAVSIRRLHDAGYPGSYYLFCLIPFVGSFVLLILLAQASNPLGARFDERPLPLPSYPTSGPPASIDLQAVSVDARAAGAGAPPPALLKQPRFEPPVEPFGRAEPTAPLELPAWGRERQLIAAEVFREPAVPDAGWAQAVPAPAIPGQQAAWSVTFPDGRQFGLERPLILGRDPATDPRYPDAVLVSVASSSLSVSKTHAVIDLANDQPRVMDLHSTNGTHLTAVDGTRVALLAGRAEPVPTGCRIALGDYELQLSRDTAANQRGR